MWYRFPVNLIVRGIMATFFLVAFLIKHTHFGWENRIRNKQLHMEVIPWYLEQVQVVLPCGLWTHLSGLPWKWTLLWKLYPISWVEILFHFLSMLLLSWLTSGGILHKSFLVICFGWMLMLVGDKLHFPSLFIVVFKDLNILWHRILIDLFGS